MKDLVLGLDHDNDSRDHIIRTTHGSSDHILLAGIDVNVSKKLDYDDNWGNLHIHLKPGYQHMDGYRAMGFVRMRHSDSDEMRSKRQHEFLEAMRAKIKTPGTFLRLPDVLNKMQDNLKYNLTSDQLFAIAN